ncbi:MAG: hypothetical protein WD824_07605 [Cyclobacteriaceae bacterium]
MKTILFLSFFGTMTVQTLQSCQSNNRDREENDQQEVNTKKETPVKLIELLVGEWEMASGAGAAGNQANNGQRLTFTEDARYIMHSGSEKIDSGAYRMNEQLRNLYLESETNEKAVEYEVEIKTDTLILSLKEDARQTGSTKQIYRRRN